MVGEADDWRLTNQGDYLQGADLTWRRYGAWSDSWDHDHCEFCFAKFVDTEHFASPAHSGDSHEFVTEGYTTTDAHEDGAGYHWICKQCFDDFRGLFEWRVVAS